MNDLEREILKQITRRTFFKQVGYGIGGLALGNLLAESVLAQGQTKDDPFAPKKPMFPAKAKHVIYLFMAGAPSQVDMFDYKPDLVKYDGQPCPADLLKGEQLAFIRGTPKMLGSPYKFEACGQSGQMISELLP